MTVLFIFGVVCIVIGLLWPKPKPIPIPPEHHDITITCDLKHGGTLDAYIHYEAPPGNPTPPSMAPTVRRWALRLEKPERSETLYPSLNRELKEFGATVTNIKLPDPKPEEVATPTLADQLVTNLSAKKDAAEAIAKVIGLERDLTGKLQKYVGDRIDDLFDHPDHV
jgi:hypothetical protein